MENSTLTDANAEAGINRSELADKTLYLILEDVARSCKKIDEGPDVNPTISLLSLLVLDVWISSLQNEEKAQSNQSLDPIWDEILGSEENGPASVKALVYQCGRRAGYETDDLEHFYGSALLDTITSFLSMARLKRNAGETLGRSTILDLFKILEAEVTADGIFCPDKTTQYLQTGFATSGSGGFVAGGGIVGFHSVGEIYAHGSAFAHDPTFVEKMRSYDVGIARDRELRWKAIFRAGVEVATVGPK